jgi:hypothetical protein
MAVALANLRAERHSFRSDSGAAAITCLEDRSILIGARTFWARLRGNEWLARVILFQA